jgi:hypothetical protein
MNEDRLRAVGIERVRSTSGWPEQRKQSSRPAFRATRSFPTGSRKPYGAGWERGFPPPAAFAGDGGFTPVAAAPPGISGILDAQRPEQGRPQELQHGGPKGKRDRLPPFFALRFMGHGRGASGGGAPWAPRPCPSRLGPGAACAISRALPYWPDLRSIVRAAMSAKRSATASQRMLRAKVSADALPFPTGHTRTSCIPSGTADRCGERPARNMDQAND